MWYLSLFLSCSLDILFLSVTPVCVCVCFSLCLLSVPVSLLSLPVSLPLSFSGVSKISDSEQKSPQWDSRVVSLCFSSSSRSDTERNAGSEPRPVPRGPAVARHAHWDDSGSEVRGPAGRSPRAAGRALCVPRGHLGAGEDQPLRGQGGNSLGV